MSTLVVDELYDGVEFVQAFKVPRNINIQHVRLWIYKEGTIVDGDLTCEIYQEGNLLATSTINYTDINTALTEDYFQGFIRFDWGDSLVLHTKESESETEYEFKFYMDNHTTDTNNFIAVCRNWEDKIYSVYGDTSGGEPVNDMVSPAGIEIYEIRSL